MNISIDTILDGWQESDFFGAQGKFLSSIGIDPDMPKDDSSKKPCGLLRPTAMAKFSGTEITGVPLWMISNPKDTNIYVYANDGKVHTITSALGMGTALNSGNALTAASGNGAEYYDNALYLATNVDITKYSPLNGSPSLAQTYWTSGLSKTALVNTTYPSINGVQMPNHVMHRHTDNKLYITDVVGNQGVLHYIKTSKTTVEGDTNNGSTYNALDFNYGEYPTCIETYGTDLVVGLIEGVNTTVIQKPARIAFWDTISASYRQITSIELHDPLITAIKNVNGVLYVFSGYATGGCRISKLVSGYSLQEVAWLPDQYPPLQGAVDHFLTRILFGSNTVEIEASASVFALGGKLSTGLQNIARATSSGANPMITCLKFAVQSDGAKILPIIGWKDDSAKGLDKISTTYGDYNIFRSELFRVGKRFQIKKIYIPLVQAVAANMTLVVKVVSGSGATTTTLATINNTNYPNSEKLIEIEPQGEFTNDFYLQLEWSGSVLLTVALPINIEIEIIR